MQGRSTGRQHWQAARSAIADGSPGGSGDTAGSSEPSRSPFGRSKMAMSPRSRLYGSCVVTQVSGGGLSPVEQALVDHAGRGEWLDLPSKGETVAEAAMRSWGDARICRATVIRDILRGRLVADPDPHGLRLRGARIVGRLDLENLTTNVSLELYECFLEEGIVARDARLLFLALNGCRLEHPAEPPLDAERLTCGALSLGGARIIGHAEMRAVNLRGAHIGAQLECTGAELRNDSGPALAADGLQVGQDMFLRGGFTATGHGDNGAVNLRGAHIGGQLACTGAELRNDSGPALAADSLEVSQSMFLTGGFTATGHGDNGAVRLLGAHIGGQLDCTGAELRNDSGPALAADGLQVGQDMFLRGGFTATGPAKRGGQPARRPHRRPARLHRGGAAQRLRARPGGRQPAGRPGHVPARRVHRHGGGADVAVDLTGARVGGTLGFDPAGWSTRPILAGGWRLMGSPTLVCLSRSPPGAGCGCCAMAPPAMRPSRISS